MKPINLFLAVCSLSFSSLCHADGCITFTRPGTTLSAEEIDKWGRATESVQHRSAYCDATACLDSGGVPIVHRCDYQVVECRNSPIQFDFQVTQAFYKQGEEPSFKLTINKDLPKPRAGCSNVCRMDFQSQRVTEADSFFITSDRCVSDHFGMPKCGTVPVKSIIFGSSDGPPLYQKGDEITLAISCLGVRATSKFLIEAAAGEERDNKSGKQRASAPAS